MKIAVVAPASPLSRETAEKVAALASARYRDGAPDLFFHPQCFLKAGHFAGADAERAAAFLDVANDGAYDAVWFARGGYGSCRLDAAVYDSLNNEARSKIYLGFSDLGTVLGRLYARGIGRAVHGPMPNDINRDGGAAAVERALDYFTRRAPETLEPAAAKAGRFAAFNITILAHLLASSDAPDLSGHIVMLEEVSEHHYRIDRSLCAIMSNPAMRKAAGIMLGRCSDIPENDVDFEQDEVQIAQTWCTRAGVPFLGRADIGHDAGNRIVPFGQTLAA